MPDCSRMAAGFALPYKLGMGRKATGTSADISWKPWVEPMQFEIPAAGDPVDPAYARLLDEIDLLAESLDQRFRLPLTSIRFGWDPVIGLVPVAGDLVSAALAVKIILAARRLGADNQLLRRMAAHTAIDVCCGIVPLVGSLFDIFYRSNVRNIELLKEEIRIRRAVSV